MGSNVHGRFGNVGQVYQAHVACLSTWVGQQGVVRVGTQTAQTCRKKVKYFSFYLLIIYLLVYMYLTYVGA